LLWLVGDSRDVTTQKSKKEDEPETRSRRCEDEADEAVTHRRVRHGVSMVSLKYCHAVPLYALRVSTPKPALQSFQGRPPAR
jgi:hypothetical protein